MPKSRNTRAKKVQSEKDRFIRLFAFCCYGWKAGPYTDDVDGAYTPAVTDFTKDLKEETGPNLELPNTNLYMYVQVGEDITMHGQTSQNVEEYPVELNQFAGDEADQIGASVNQMCDRVDEMGYMNDDHGNIYEIKKKINSIEDYPEQLNPFANEE